MRLKQSVNSLFFVVFILLLTISCSRIKSDAKKAAKYTEKSIAKTNQMKLNSAEKYYLKSQEIFLRYESHKKAERFYNLYERYRDEGKYPEEIDESGS